FDNNITLGSVNSGESQDYQLNMSFDKEAGNEYQNKTIDFDFVITAEEIPPVIIPGGRGYTKPSIAIGYKNPRFLPQIHN
ncbi:unnamed protein product, partial [marine sediment metagenome]